MSCIQYCVQQVKHQIPLEVLNKAFMTGNTVNCGFFANLDEEIRLKVLVGRVIKDTNLVGGMEVDLSTDDAIVTSDGGHNTSYHYTDESLHGHEILSVLRFMEGVSGYGFAASPNATMSSGLSCNTTQSSCGASSSQAVINGLGKALMSTGGGSSPPSNTMVRMVAKNTILVSNSYTQRTGYFRVAITNDPELNNIQPRTWPAFSKLVVAAAKAYIYNILVIAVGQGFLYGGAELNNLTDYVNSLDNSEQEYQDLLQGFRAIAFMNDPVKHTDYIRLQLNPFL